LEEVGFLSRRLREEVQREASETLKLAADRVRDLISRIESGSLASTKIEGGFRRDGFCGVMRVQRFPKHTLVHVSDPGMGYLFFSLRSDAFGVLIVPCGEGGGNQPLEDYHREWLRDAILAEENDAPRGLPSMVLGSWPCTAWWCRESCIGMLSMSDLGRIGFMLDDLLYPDNKDPGFDLKPLKLHRRQDENS
jgi:hypothetical protein